VHGPDLRGANASVKATAHLPDLLNGDVDLLPTATPMTPFEDTVLVPTGVKSLSGKAQLLSIQAEDCAPGLKTRA
jgi:hypothetical protein